MLSFIADITDNTDATYTVVLLDEDSMGQPRQYELRPKVLRRLLFGSLFAVVILVSLLFVFTPILELVPGRSIGDVRRAAQDNVDTMRRLQDSLAVQAQYIDQLQRLMTGIEGDNSFDEPTTTEFGVGMASEAVLEEPPSDDWEDHAQPALTLDRLPAVRATHQAPVPASIPRGYISSLRFPARPPVEGYMTRGFSAMAAHFAVDFAVPEGTPVQSIGDGHVIFADWTNDGGYTILVHHTEGYVSVFKHNQRLLKRVGDRVVDREAIAISGNSGELTSGPHIHVELWHDGLAQDPQQYFIQ
jgi:murein DD-endopeptidase MepM/ murein hydrolase activator NlpD